MVCGSRPEIVDAKVRALRPKIPARNLRARPDALEQHERTRLQSDTKEIYS